jgi:catechol 2,3-dioxygenase-like lactoylglutathione lyase family enzyme
MLEDVVPLLSDRVPERMRDASQMTGWRVERRVSMGLRNPGGDSHLTMVEGHATVLLVEDVRRATDYYRDMLGFEVELYANLPDHYGYARRGGCHIHFARFDGAHPRPNSVAAPPDMFDAYVYVDDVEGLHAELVGRRAEVVHGPVDQGYGLREFRIRDPDGYILAFGQPHSE